MQLIIHATAAVVSIYSPDMVQQFRESSQTFLDPWVKGQFVRIGWLQFRNLQCEIFQWRQITGVSIVYLTAS